MFNNIYPNSVFTNTGSQAEESQRTSDSSDRSILIISNLMIDKRASVGKKQDRVHRVNERLPANAVECSNEGI